jgi:hypothetical protein
LGRITSDGEDYSDTISLVEGRRDTEINRESNIRHKIDLKKSARRGRSRKQRDKSKLPKHSKMGKPKFIQLGEALKDGGGRGKKNKHEEKGADAKARLVSQRRETEQSSGEKGSLNTVVPESAQEFMLEVVLPGLNCNQNSGLVTMQYQEGLEGQLIQQVGFCYKESKEEVVNALDSDEQRDRLKKREWEQKIGSQ